MKTMMKAVRYHDYSGPEVLCYEDTPNPIFGSSRCSMMNGYYLSLRWTWQFIDYALQKGV